jgi:RNA polymerase sigma factor (sigma-70 family)
MEIRKKDGRQLMAKGNILGDDEIRALIPAARAGDQDAMMRIVDSQEGLIWNIAKRWRGAAFEMDDLLQIGRIGVVRAVRAFDPDAGAQFNTFAVRYIRTEIRNEAIGRFRAMRVPYWIFPVRKKARKHANERGISVDAALVELGYSNEARDAVRKASLTIIDEDISPRRGNYCRADSPDGFSPTTEDRGPDRVDDADFVPWLIGGLPPHHRPFAVMVLGLDGRDLDHRRIAAEIGSNAGCVRERKRRVLRMMRERASMALGA